MNLGNAGVRVSQLCIGGWQLPGSGDFDESGVEAVDLQELRRIIGKAIDGGINFIDTANRYHGRMSPTDLGHAGNSERVLGTVLKDYERESFVLATKVRVQMMPWPNGEGLSRKHVMWQIRESLTRLQLDYIDVYQVHAPDQLTPKRETLKTLNSLIDRGLVRYIGESNCTAADTIEFMSMADSCRLECFVSMQEPYSLIQRAIEVDKFPVAKKYGMAVLAYSPLAQGVLSGKYLKGVEKGSRASYATDSKDFTDPKVLGAIRELETLAKEKQITLSQLAISWILHKQSEFGITIIPVVGITRLSHLEEDIGALDVKLGPDDVRHVDEIASKVQPALPS